MFDVPIANRLLPWLIMRHIYLMKLSPTAMANSICCHNLLTIWPCEISKATMATQQLSVLQSTIVN